MTRWLRLAVAAAALVMASATASLAQTWPAELPPRPLAARPFSFPPYEIRTLENGLQVVAVLHHEQPVISMRLIVRAGAANDPPGKAGLANLAASLLDQGSAAMSANDVNDAIDYIGGGMGAGAGTDLTYANVIVMKDSFEAGLRMLSDMARTPAFAQEEIDRQRQQVLSSLRVNLSNPEFVADAVFDRLVYGSHPYGQPQSGTPATLASITRADLVAFHRQHFMPNNAILAIVGDIAAEDAFNDVIKVFGGWERRELERPQPVPPPEPLRRVVIVNKPDAVQTEVRVGHLGVRRNSSDYMALNMTLRILGGEGANRLFQVLRSERGLTYGAKADFHTFLDSGDFEASTNTRSEATGEALRLIVDQFWRLQRERVGERELRSAKDYLTGSFPITIETPDAIATQVLNVLFYGLDVEQLQSFRDRVNAVSPEDVERVARYYLRPDRLSVVLVGNAAAFTAQLRGLGFGNFDVIEMSDLDLTSADFRRLPGASPVGAALPRAAGQEVQYQNQSGSVPVARTPPAARQLLAAAIDAKGGLERLRALKSLVVRSRSRGLGGSAGEPVAESVTSLAYPNRVRIQTKTPDGGLVQVYDGTHAWVSDPSGTREVPERLLIELESGLKRDIIVMLLAAQDGRITARLLPPIAGAGGQAAAQALEFSGPGLGPTVLYLDPDTHRVVRQTYVPGGLGQGVVEEVYEDYRGVDGIQFAFKATVVSRGEPVMEREILDVAVNRPLGPETFARPTP